MPFQSQIYSELTDLIQLLIDIADIFTEDDVSTYIASTMKLCKEMLTVTPVLAISWSSAAVFDTVIFLLTVFKRVHEGGGLKGGLLSMMLRDGERLC